MKDNPFGLEGRVAVVTGGGRGIGKAISTALVFAGAKEVAPLGITVNAVCPGLTRRNRTSCCFFVFRRSGIHYRGHFEYQRRRPDDLNFSIASKGEGVRMKFTL